MNLVISMKKIALLLLLVVVLIFGGKFYLESRYESAIDQGIQLVSSVMSVRYDKVNIGFDGSIALLGLSGQMTSGKGSYSIEEISLSTSDRLFPLFAENIVKNAQYPESMQLAFREYSIDSTLLETADQAKPCQSFFETVVYSDIGFDKSVGDINVSLDFSDNSDVQIDWYFEDQVGSAEIRTQLNKSILKISRAPVDKLPINEVRIAATVKPDAANRIVSYCANKLGLTSQAYLDYLGSPGYSVKSFGVDLGVQVRNAIVKYQQGGSNVVVSSRPSPQLKSLNSLKFFKKRDIVRLLRLSILSDGENVVINPFEETTSESTEVAKNSKVNIEPANKILNPSLTTTEPAKREFQAVPLRQVGNYVNHDVRLKRKGDKSAMEGYLLSLQDNVLSIEINRHGGVMTYTVPTAEIREVLVFK